MAAFIVFITYLQLMIELMMCKTTNFILSRTQMCLYVYYFYYKKALKIALSIFNIVIALNFFSLLKLKLYQMDKAR